MSSEKVVKCRIFETDNEILKATAFKLAAKYGRVVTQKEVLRALINYADKSGNCSPAKISEEIGNNI